MLQLKMIELFKEGCHEDARIIAALMFGSFAIGEGDEFSDIEFAVFIQDDHFENFDQRSWLNAVSPVAAYFPDDFSTTPHFLKTAFAVNSISCENRTYRSFPLGKAMGGFPRLRRLFCWTDQESCQGTQALSWAVPRYVKARRWWKGLC